MYVRGLVPRATALAALLVGLDGPAFARAFVEEKCELLTSCLGPTAKPGGLAHDGEALWVGSYSLMRIDRVDPATCQLLRSIPAPGANVGGLAWDGSTLWCMPEDTGRIYQLRPSDGFVLRSIPAPSFGQKNPNGGDLAWDGEALWHVDYTFDRVYRLNPADGTVLASFPAPGVLPSGIEWFEGTLIVADSGVDDLFLMDPTDGHVIRSCPSPDAFPWGLAVSPDSLVHLTGVTTRRLYTEDLGLESDPFENYCTASENSTGAPALMSAEGSVSLATNDLVLIASPVPPTLGMFWYGPNQAETPFGNGWRCLGKPICRMGIAKSHGGELRKEVDYDRLPRRGTITAGSTWNFQVWYLDRKGEPPRFNLTDGLTATFEP
jgi:hypothetical protein